MPLLEDTPRRYLIAALFIAGRGPPTSVWRGVAAPIPPPPSPLLPERVLENLQGARP